MTLGRNEGARLIGRGREPRHAMEIDRRAQISEAGSGHV